MKSILIFAGTTEGRELIEFTLSNTEYRIYACVATEYGKSLLTASERLTVSSKPLNTLEMCQLMKQVNFSLVLDATHPYATEVSKNIKKAADICRLPYYRVLRPENECVSDITFSESDHIVTVNSMEDAVTFFRNTNGNILATTGSKELSALCGLPDYKVRVYPRILPNPDMLQMIIDQGFAPQNIICMQGPFSADLNVAMLQQINAAFLLTKSSGTKGGFPEKIAAAARLSITAVVIGRPPQTEGISLEQAYQLLLTKAAQTL